MKILHVIANLAPRYGGPPKACFEMAKAVANLGHKVTIYTTNQDGPTELDVPTDQPVFRDGVEILCRTGFATPFCAGRGLQPRFVPDGVCNPVRNVKFCVHLS
jgi:hypothetical protein